MLLMKKIHQAMMSCAFHSYIFVFLTLPCFYMFQLHLQAITELPKSLVQEKIKPDLPSSILLCEI